MRSPIDELTTGFFRGLGYRAARNVPMNGDGLGLILIVLIGLFLMGTM